MVKHLFVFNIVGLSPKYLARMRTLPTFSRLIGGGQTATLEPVFPCLTLPGQASIATGAYPEKHGMIANGLYDRDRMEVGLWEQYRSLLQAEPIWERIKAKSPEIKTAVLFWQSTLYGKADFIITPKPIHADHKLIEWCYSKPVGLYEKIAQKLGPFSLMSYWGPFASAAASKWIMGAATDILKEHRPNLMMVYMPHLDYSCQRLGPENDTVYKDLEVADQLIGNFLEEIERLGILNESCIVLLSEYALTEVLGAVTPNRVLRDAEFLNIREINGGEYVDFEFSPAFAMVDHQIAHVYIKDKRDESKVFDLLSNTPGIASVIDKSEKQRLHIDHPRSGELIAVSAADRWFAYYWWFDDHKAPDYARTIDIHRKPGYDPLELFFDPETKAISLDTSLIRGSHGVPADTPEKKSLFILSGKEAMREEIPPSLDTIHVSSIFEKLLVG